eukprot:TRINITY_DN425_c0_g1_i1.p1 TRINITY_DN425_c0_g1~~TRINITY_DN425_c0_g1_i1.p1  ORF type:complete len:281 (+),score=133.28 TRINITY_DN425_c0_g1_i1:138-980(+)
MDDLLETTLLVIRECFVYKIPIRGATGFKAADWDLPNPLWTGRLVITGKGEQAFVKLEDSSTGEPFALCPVTEASIEPVNDSSRYYVLKIEDGQKRHAFIGIGFSERDEAFNFSAALQDHARFVKQEKEAAIAEKNLSSKPSVDYSLKQGEKITVNISGHSNRKTREKSSDSDNSSGFAGLLPPPPGSKPKTATSPSVPQQSSNNNSNNFLNFGQSAPQTQQNNFSNFNFPQQTQQQQQFQPQQQISNDPFAGLSSFSSPPQQQRPQQPQNNAADPFGFL